jgi:predicted RNA-binding Zn-ribbon protein involved in translation (DUF1610 family)
MFGRSRQFEICCDAPPYGVVRACEKCGYCSPLDVRWCRLSHFVSGEGQRRDDIGLRLWHWLFGKRKPRVKTCTCGQRLPVLKKVGFTFLCRKAGDYLLGQCPRCRTMFWDEALLLPAWMEDSVAGLTDSGEM